MRCFCPLPYYILTEEKGKNMGEVKMTFHKIIKESFLRNRIHAVVRCAKNHYSTSSFVASVVIISPCLMS